LRFAWSAIEPSLVGSGTKGANVYEC
jgi:hypothetical protein